MNYVIMVQGSYYHTNKSAKNNRLDANFHDAIIYENTTKEEVEIIAKDLFKDCRCFWDVVEYNEAEKYYDRITYVDPETKQYRWSYVLNVKEALEAIKKGTIVGCKYDDKISIFEDSKVPDYINSEAILKGVWRIIIPVK